MPKRAGSYLEESVSVLFNKAGFKTKLNSRINGYEIDVLASKGNYNIAIECKQYERSHLTIRNILHQWASKSNIINVDKIMVAIAGQIPKEEDYKLAKQLNIILIDDYTIHKLNSIMDKDKLKSELNDLICFDKKLYSKKRKKRLIMGLIVFGFIMLIFYLFYYAIKNKLISSDVMSILSSLIFGVLLGIIWFNKKNRKK
ncbi:MAG: restriction endonuclease [Nanoarchaeota archaeon]